MSEYGVVRRHRGDGSAGFANKTALPIKNLRYIYIEGSYDPHAGGLVNDDGTTDPVVVPCTLNFYGQYGGPLQWLPDANSAGMRQIADGSRPVWGLSLIHI